MQFSCSMFTFHVYFSSCTSELTSGVKDVTCVYTHNYNYDYLLRMALLDRIRGWFYYVFIRGKDKRSGGDLSRLSVIGDIPIRSSRKHSHFTDGDQLAIREGPEKVGSLYSKTLTLITKTGQK